MEPDVPLIDLLGQLEAKLAKQDAPIVGWFRPGLAGDEVAATLAAQGKTCPADLRTWFEWHNGAKYGHDAIPDPCNSDFYQVPENDLGGGLYLWHVMALTDCLWVERWLRGDWKLIGMDGVPAPWFPLLYHGAGIAWLWCDTSSEALPLHVVDFGAEAPPEPQFPSLRHFIHVVLDFLDANLPAEFRAMPLDAKLEPLVRWPWPPS